MSGCAAAGVEDVEVPGGCAGTALAFPLRETMRLLMSKWLRLTVFLAFVAFGPAACQDPDPIGSNDAAVSFPDASANLADADPNSPDGGAAALDGGFEDAGVDGGPDGGDGDGGMDDGGMDDGGITDGGKPDAIDGDANM